jgi:hypothetical protein
MDPIPGSPQDPQSLHKYTYCKDNPVNSRDPSGMDTLADVVVSMAITAALAAIVSVAASTALSVIKGGDVFPNAGLFGLSDTLSGNAMMTSVVSMINELTMSDAGRRGRAAIDLLSFPLGFGATGGDFPPIPPQFVGGTFTLGAELLVATADCSRSLWSYAGPGGYVSLTGGGNPVGASASFYMGMVWNVKGWDDYAGPFVSIGAGQSVFGVGWTVSWFFNPSNAMQTGMALGLSVSLPPGTKLAKSYIPDFSASYVVYEPAWSQYVDSSEPLLWCFDTPPFFPVYSSALQLKWYLSHRAGMKPIGVTGSA